MVWFVPGQDITKAADGKRVVTIGSVYQRDYPTNFMRLWENVSDPAHFAFTHAGIAADRSACHSLHAHLPLETAPQQPATLHTACPASI